MKRFVVLLALAFVLGTFSAPVFSDHYLVDNSYEFGSKFNDTLKPVPVVSSPSSVDEHTEVTFDGSGSYDMGNGTIVHYNWTFDDQGTVTLYGSSVKYTFSIPGVYDVTLKVTDNSSNFNSTQFPITVNDVTGPVVLFSSPSIVDEEMIYVFNGTGTYDPEGGSIVNLTWTFTDQGEPRTLNGSMPNHTFELPGQYDITLEGTDAVGNSNSDMFTLTVNDTTKPVPIMDHFDTAVEDTLVVFNGSQSYDPEMGVITNYDWEIELNDTVSVLFVGVECQYLFTIPGKYNIYLQVEDEAGNYDSLVSILTVLDATVPIANAGPDRTVNENSLLTFNGNGSVDPENGTITGHSRRSINLSSYPGQRPSIPLRIPGHTR